MLLSNQNLGEARINSWKSKIAAIAETVSRRDLDRVICDNSLNEFS